MTVSVSAKDIFQDSYFEENKILWPELRSLMWYVFDTSTWEMVRQGDFELKASLGYIKANSPNSTEMSN